MRLDWDYGLLKSNLFGNWHLPRNSSEFRPKFEFVGQNHLKLILSKLISQIDWLKSKLFFIFKRLLFKKSVLSYVLVSFDKINLEMILPLNSNSALKRTKHFDGNILIQILIHCQFQNNFNYR